MEVVAYASKPSTREAETAMSMRSAWVTRNYPLSGKKKKPKLSPISLEPRVYSASQCLLRFKPTMIISQTSKRFLTNIQIKQKCQLWCKLLELSLFLGIKR